FFPVRIVPEPDRHRGERRRADELAFLLAHRTAVFVVHLDLHAESAALDLPAPDRTGGIAEREAAHDVRAAGDRCELNVAFHVRVHVIEALGHEWRTRREYRFHAGEIVRLRGLEAGFRARVDEFRGGAEDRHALPLREIEDDVVRG